MPDLAQSAAFISTAPTTRRERTVAAGAIAVSLVGFCVTAPFAQLQLLPLPAFIPLNQAAFFINDLITAILLLVQAPHLRSRALVVLACGYIFDALMIIPHTLTFPGLFSPTGLLGAGEQSTAWIYMFWHSGFPLFVIAYAMMREHPDRDRLKVQFWRSVLLSLFGVASLVCALTALTTAGQDVLPRVMFGNFYTPFLRFWTSATWLFSVAALACLYRRRRLTALDLWLSVVMCAWVLDVALSAVFNQGRFDLGFYAGRVYGLIAASFVLTALLVESSYLYARIQRSREQLIQAQKMEAIGLLTGGIAHDFNNLLMVVRGAIELAESQPGAVEHEKLVRLLRPAKRAVDNGTVLTRSLLAFAKRQPLAPTNIDINRLVEETSELLQRTLGGAIRIETALSASPSLCSVDPNQLENAVLNLAVNARDAMPSGGVLTIETNNADLDVEDAPAHGISAGRYILISVTDTGAGMSPEVQQQAFEPFFTTKGPDRGTGLGLSQVYGFVNQSGGHIRLCSKVGHGTTVKIYLPLDAENEEREVIATGNGGVEEPEPIGLMDDECQEAGAVRRMAA